MNTVIMKLGYAVSLVTSVMHALYMLTEVCIFARQYLFSGLYYWTHVYFKY